MNYIFVLLTIITILLIFYYVEYGNIKYLDNLESHNNELKDFEKRLSQFYPLCNDMFRIDHGTNYFKFFQRIGKPYYYGIYNNDILVGTIAYIKTGENIYYIADLKFDPIIRNKGYFAKLVRKSMMSMLFTTKVNYLKLKVYAISMNDNNSKTNNILRKTSNIMKFGCILNIYSLSYEQIIVVKNIIEKCKNKKLNFVSLNNTKDLILKSTNKPINILHIEYCDSTLSEPLKDFQHMFCTNENSDLSNILKTQYNILPISTATVMHYNMSDTDWEFIQTSHI